MCLQEVKDNDDARIRLAKTVAIYLKRLQALKRHGDLRTLEVQLDELCRYGPFTTSSYGNIVYNGSSLLQGLESELEGMKKENYLRRLWKKNSTQTKLLDREKAIRAELDSWHVCPPNTVLIDALLTV